MGDTGRKLLQGMGRLLTGRHGKRRAGTPQYTKADQHFATDVGRKDFSAEMFACLLLELPEHRQALLDARAAQDIDALGRCAHKLLGAVVYCDLPELDGALRRLREAIRSGDLGTVSPACNASVQAIEVLLASSGCNQGSSD